MALLQWTLFFSEDRPPSLGEAYCQAFFGPSDAPGTTKERWENTSGVFLFLNVSKDSIHPENLIKALRMLLNEPAYLFCRFIWIDNPGDPLANWHFRYLTVKDKKGEVIVAHQAYFDLGNYSFSISRGNGIKYDDSRKMFIIDRHDNLEGFEWSAGHGAFRMQRDQNHTYKITAELLRQFKEEKILPEAIIAELPADLAFDTQKELLETIGPVLDAKQQVQLDQLTGSDEDLRKRKLIIHSFKCFREVITTFSRVNTEVPVFGRKVFIPMAGEAAGCLKFELRILKKGKATTQFGYPALPYLDASIRLFMRDPAFPDTKDTFYLSSHRYPVISEWSAHDEAYAFYPSQLTFHGSIDPLNPLQHERSFFAFQEPIETAETGIPFAFRTNLGFTLHMRPMTDAIKAKIKKEESDFKVEDSRLVFSALPQKIEQKNLESYCDFYLTPAGDFEMVVPHYQAEKPLDPNRTNNLLCGISGVEYIRLAAGKTQLLSFRPGYPAYAPSYLSTAALLRDLRFIINEYAVNLLPAGADLDMDVESELNGGLGITDEKRLLLLEHARKDYFPPGYHFDEDAQTKFREIQTVEEMINWLLEKLRGTSVKAASLTDPLNELITTSWVYVRQPGPGNVAYYAQPEQAPLYKPSAGSQGFFEFMEVPAVGLPDSLPAIEHILAFPILPYGNIDGEILADLEALENHLVSKFRRARIHQIGRADKFQQALVATGETPTELTGATPQGLVAEFSEDLKVIKKLHLGKSSNGENLTIENIRYDPDAEHSLKGALQSNPLFLVISDPETLTQSNDHPLRPYLAKDKLNIEGWEFDLDPDKWFKHGTILIFKFQDKPLLELAAKPELWDQPDGFNDGDPEFTSKRLVKLLDDAIRSSNSEDPVERRKYEMLARISQFEAWTGILALNTFVPLGGLPDDLKALAAGINKDKFYAQYVGVEVTPIEPLANGGLRNRQSSIFGLIDYKNEGIPLPDDSGYNFHVPLLTVIFQNSLVTDFAAEILLVADRLFDEPTQLYLSPTGRNIVTLKGAAERHNGKVTYTFGFSGANHFLLPKSQTVLEVEIVKAQFATDTINSPEDDPLSISGRFSFWGRLKFRYLKEFDILSFGPLPDAALAEDSLRSDDNKPIFLTFGNLQVVMSFTLHQEANKITDRKFTFNPHQITFDLERSAAREHSLYEKFPLKLVGMRYEQDKPNALSGSGFMPVKSPLGSNQLGNTWYGMTYDLNLGSVGAMAGKAGLVVSILVAWSPSTVEGGGGTYVGLKLPGSSGGKKEIVIQNIVKIVFKRIELVVYPLSKDIAEGVIDFEENKERAVGYLLKLKNIVLKFFLVSFPPSGQTEIILFGDPREVDREDKLLGWYASYSKK